MSYKNNNKLKKSIAINVLLYCTRIVYYIFFVYALISFVFWFLNCFEVDWLYIFHEMFVLPYSWVSKFYTPQEESVDFVLAIIGGLSLLCAFLVNALYKKILYLEINK